MTTGIYLAIRNDGGITAGGFNTHFRGDVDGVSATCGYCGNEVVAHIGEVPCPTGPTRTKQP